jgi:hypothetical protein
VAPDVSQDFSSQSELADCLAIQTRLLRCGGRGEFDVLYAKRIKGSCDGYFGLPVEESIGELLAF